jgi:predicted short-subunit dehydrogenase-like oxidoreductase (DUF2520 family)
MALRKQVDETQRVLVFGAGKVGSTLARALRKSGYQVRLRAARKGVPRRKLALDLLIIAVRDPDIAGVAREFANVLPPHAVVVHTAGALGPEVLAALAPCVAGVGQMHPLLSFAAASADPRALQGATLLVTGDASAVREVKKLAHRLGAEVQTVPKLDRVRYHAGAALLANGSAALAALAVSLMTEAGMPPARVPRALAALLRSVARNLETVGVPGLLTGPVRRGDLEAIKRQAAVLQGPALAAFRGLLAPQLELARAIGEAPEASFDAMAAWLREQCDAFDEQLVDRRR